MQEGGGKQRRLEHLPHSDLPLQGPPVPGVPRDLLAGSRPRNRAKYPSKMSQRKGRPPKPRALFEARNK